jgi:adenylate kinase family enzyme
VLAHSTPVPLLRFDETLPCRPARVVVAGTSGAGKTTLAARIAEVLGVPHVELDGLFHGPGWTPRPSFLADVEQFSAQPAWVTEWQYGDVRPLLAQRADLMVWLDLARVTVMRQVVTRTVSRRWRGQRLWNGNVEPPLWTALRHDDHVVRWAWTTHAPTRERVLRLQQTRPDLVVVRLQTHRQADAWLAGPLPGTTGQPPRRVVRP